MLWFRKLCLLCCCTLFMGCGFVPLYAPPNTAVVEDLSKIKISLISDRSGQMFRNHLIHTLTPYGQPAKPKYHLSVKLTFVSAGLVFLNDETASRMQINLTCAYTLTEKGTKITSGSFIVTTDYNIIMDTDYSTVIAEESANNQAVFLAANQLKLVLADYFLGASEISETKEVQTNETVDISTS